MFSMMPYDDNDDDGRQAVFSDDDVSHVIYHIATSAKLTNPTNDLAALRNVLYEGDSEPDLTWAVTVLGVFCNQIPDSPADVLNAATRHGALHLIEPAFSLGFADVGISLLRLAMKLDKPLVTAHMYGTLLLETRSLNPRSVHYICQSLMHLVHSECRQQRIVQKALAGLSALVHPSNAYHNVVDTCDLRADLHETFLAHLLSKLSSKTTRVQCVIGLGCCVKTVDGLTSDVDEVVRVLRSHADVRTEPCPKARTAAVDVLISIAIDDIPARPNLDRAVMCIEPILRLARFDPDEDVIEHCGHVLQTKLFGNMCPPSGVSDNNTFALQVTLTSAELFPSLMTDSRVICPDDVAVATGTTTSKLASTLSRLLSSSHVSSTGVWIMLHGFAKCAPSLLTKTTRTRMCQAANVLRTNPAAMAWCFRALTLLCEKSSLKPETVVELINSFGDVSMTPDALRAMVKYAASRADTKHIVSDALKFYAQKGNLPSSLECVKDRNALAVLCAALHATTPSSSDPTIRGVMTEVTAALMSIVFDVKEAGRTTLAQRWKSTLPLDQWMTVSEALLDVLQTHHETLRPLVQRFCRPQPIFSHHRNDEPGISRKRVVLMDTIHDLVLLYHSETMAECFLHVIRSAPHYCAETVLCALECTAHLTQEGTMRVPSQLLSPLLALIGASHPAIKQRAFDIVSRLMTTSDHYHVVSSLLFAAFIMNAFPHSHYTADVELIAIVPSAQRQYIYNHFVGIVQRKASEAVTRLLQVVTELLASPPDTFHTAHSYWSVVEDLLVLSQRLGMKPNHPLFATASSLISTFPCDVPSSVWTALQSSHVHRAGGGGGIGVEAHERGNNRPVLSNVDPNKMQPTAATRRKRRTTATEQREHGSRQHHVVVDDDDDDWTF
eukprot:PhM_4_TR10443/c0_g1_i1/m.96391